MASPRSEALVVPYGTERVAESVRRLVRAGRLDALNVPGAPVAVWPRDRRAPLRLSDVVHPFTRPPVTQDLAHAARQFAVLGDHLMRLCGDWAKPRRRFVEHYLAAVRAHVAAREDELMGRCAALAGLVEPEHWCFAAPMPLPRAHLWLGEPAAARGADAVAVDVAFWTGEAIAACVIEAGTPLGRRRRALERLDAAGVRVERVAPADLAGDPAALLERLGAPFTDFTAGLARPASPFRGRGVPDPAEA